MIAAASAALIFAALALVAVGITAVAPSARLLADCTQTRSGASTSIVCSPNITGGLGDAPSEADITAKNAQRAHGYVIGV